MNNVAKYDLDEYEFELNLGELYSQTFGDRSRPIQPVALAQWNLGSGDSGYVKVDPALNSISDIAIKYKEIENGVTILSIGVWLGNQR